MELKKFVEDYSLDNYNEDYSVFLTLTYSKPLKYDHQCFKQIIRLRDYLMDNNVFIDGVMSTEYGSNFKNLHCHLLLYSDTDYYLTHGMIYNFWKNIGWCKVDRYDSQGSQVDYMMKHLYKTDNNNLNILKVM